MSDVRFLLGEAPLRIDDRYMQEEPLDEPCTGKRRKNGRLDRLWPLPPHLRSNPLLRRILAEFAAWEPRRHHRIPGTGGMVRVNH
jgi:hypothetical protein